MRQRDHLIHTIDRQLEDVDLRRVCARAPKLAQAGLEHILNLVNQGQVTSEDLVAYYLLRIRNVDQIPGGCNAVSEVAPDAIAQARRADLRRAQAHTRPDTSEGEWLALLGIPILVKENINTADMPTSAGTWALADFVPATDAPVITRLRQAGAIILGKTNLSELSYWMTANGPSGYSAKAGQTHSPFRPAVADPEGSSTGSAVAMATDLALLSLGTETLGSIVAPSSLASAVGFKPTRDLIESAGVVPISRRLDTIGPITRTVSDADALFNAATGSAFAPSLNPRALEGKRIGIDARAMTDPHFGEALRDALHRAGAQTTLIDIDHSRMDFMAVMMNDFEADFTAYLHEHDAPITSLAGLIAYNLHDEDKRAPYGQYYLEKSCGIVRDEPRAHAQVCAIQAHLDEVMSTHHLDAIAGRGSDLAVLATSGAPEISIPCGAWDGIPVGAAFLARRGCDEELLNLAYAFEQATRARVTPSHP